jgi:hypothetical protein
LKKGGFLHQAMISDDPERTRLAFKPIPENLSGPIIREAVIHPLLTFKKHILILVQRGLYVLLSIPLLAIGLAFIMFSRSVGPRKNGSMSKRWPILFGMKDRLQVMLHDIQRKYAPRFYGR